MRISNLTLGLILFTMTTLVRSAPPEEISCSHIQVCNLIEEILKETPQKNKVNILPKVTLTMTVKGDPHHFDPGIEDIKILIKAPYLVTAPMELQPWLSKIVQQRGQSATTVVLKIPPSTQSQYHTSTSSLSHFWLYPSLLCDFKRQLGDHLIQWEIKNKEIKEAKANSDSLCNSFIDEIEQSLKQKAKQLKHEGSILILTHGALTPLLTQYGLPVYTLKGSGHHEEISPHRLKQIDKIIAEKRKNGSSKILWIVEKGLSYNPQWIEQQKRPQDRLLEIEVEGVAHTSPFQVLRELVKAL